MPKISVLFKTPDAVDVAFDARDEAERRLEELGRPYTPEELDRLAAYWKKYFEYAASKYVKNGEYCTIEIDTDTGEARVLPVSGWTTEEEKRLKEAAEEETTPPS